MNKDLVTYDELQIELRLLRMAIKILAVHTEISNTDLRLLVDCLKEPEERESK